MDPQLLSIHYRDPLWIALAFLCGLGVRGLGLPPMVGFLLAGFALNGLGAQGGEFLNATADLGITLLLFSIGLKLKLKSLARPEVWGVASLHMIVVTLLVTGLLLPLTYTGLPLVADIEPQTALLIGFAACFSSTVFAVKILDELGATSARDGRTAIGVLVVQDIAAVIFIAASMGKAPSPWALALLTLIPLRFVLAKILDRVGHGELLILFGITLALIGADVFELVGIKADVGALVCGMLLANHPKATELAKSLLGFKELFLVGFFLSVGMTAVPGWQEVCVGMLFILLLPLKTALYLALFSLFRLRASTSWRTALNLANYSEFGLIVGAMAASAGWLPGEWLAVFAVAMSASFAVSAPLINVRDRIYQSWRPRLKRIERQKRLAGEEDLELTHIKVAVFGMGRMGKAAYDAMAADFPNELIGLEISPEKAELHQSADRNIVIGDATNPDLWTRAPGFIDSLEWVLLTLPTHQAILNAAHQLREKGYTGRIAATAKYHDEEKEYQEVGVNHTFNIYEEAGVGFANELEKLLELQSTKDATAQSS